MRRLQGSISNATSGKPVPAAIVRAGSDVLNDTTTRESGFFELQIADNEQYIEVYAIGTGDDGYTRLYIPEPYNSFNGLPGNTIWNIELQNDSFETGTMEIVEKKNKMKLWPLYAGLGLLLLLLLKKKR
jgi:hypothetical protein